MDKLEENKKSVNNIWDEESNHSMHEKNRGINRNILPLGIYLKHFSLIYEGNLLIQEIIIFKIVKN